MIFVLAHHTSCGMTRYFTTSLSDEQPCPAIHQPWFMAWSTDLHQAIRFADRESAERLARTLESEYEIEAVQVAEVNGVLGVVREFSHHPSADGLEAMGPPPGSGERER